jgi:glucose-6-phosphate 1-dehydrogenase
MTFAAFGITGDLMRLKILPALHGLYNKGELAEDTRIVGISRKPWSDAELRDYIKGVLPEAGGSFLSLFTFLQGDAENVETFSKLSKISEGGELMVYLALSPALYAAAFSNMQGAGITRLMIEKPFGTSGAVAEELYTQLQNILPEQNIFFVDHYLAKDWVRGLKELPVARENISHIHINFFETVGVEKRGVSYDQLGALRDVGQNHMLQIAAQILGEIPPPSPAETARTQYEGYRDIQGVAADSQTETYFKIHTPVLTLEGGKMMPDSSKEVILSLKDGSEITISEFPNKVPEYEMLISAAMKGDQSLFPSINDIRAQWRFIDPTILAWKEVSF